MVSTAGVKLAYVNRTPEIMAWVEDFKRRSNEVGERRHAWMKELYDAAGVPEESRQARGYDDGQFAGLTWPRELDDKLPKGWFRPVKTPHLVRPRGGSPEEKAVRQFNKPNGRGELERKFGMHGITFAGSWLTSCGIQYEDDGVWVTWAAREVADEPWAQKLPEFGWERVSLVDYIARFGEDAL